MTCSKNFDIIMNPQSLSVPSALGPLVVKYANREFTVIDAQNNSSQIKRCFLSKELQGISPEQLVKLQEAAHFSLTKVEDTYRLQLQPRLCGGTLGGTLIEYGGKTVKAVWEFGKHRGVWEWITQAKPHRTVWEWVKQTGHRTVWQWISGKRP